MTARRLSSTLVIAGLALVVTPAAHARSGAPPRAQQPEPNMSPVPPVAPQPGLLSPQGQSIDDLYDAWKFRAADRALQDLRVVDPASPEVLYLDGYRLFLSGDYTAAVAKLRVADTQAPGHRSVRGLLALAQAAGEVIKDHREKRSDNFILRYPPEDEVLVDHALETLEATLAALRTDLGFTPEQPIVVDIYRSAEDLAAVSPLTVADVERTGTIALCKWARLMATSPRALRFGYPWLDTLSHELVHYVVSALSRDRVPVWFQEGLAKFLESRWRQPIGADLPPSMQHMLARALSGGKLISFDAMHPSMAKLPRAEDAALAFAEVATAVAFMFETGGVETLRTAIAGIEGGQDAQKSVAQAMNMPWDTFEKRWRSYMKSKRYRSFPHFEPMKPRLRKGAALAAGRAPSEDEAVLEQDPATRYLRLGNMLLLRRRPRAAAVEYEKGARRARPGQWLFPIKLGRTYLALGEPDKALAAVGEFRQLYPELPWPHLIAGRALLKKDDPQAAIVALEASLANNPFDPEVHCALAEAYAQAPVPDGTARRERARRHCQALSD